MAEPVDWNLARMYANAWYGDDNGIAQIARGFVALDALVGEMAEMLSDSVSGFIPGCEADGRWNQALFLPGGSNGC